ncbi:MAG: rRNA maturation RNase YbeY [Marinifilaceae bacterium]|jgi:rRNA maturation RNase YbeY|nr:rRNA maturation RNase YbeY [Marinifilaceae bacterium]
MIDFCFEDIDENSLPLTGIEEWVQKVIEKNNKQLGDITYIFCTDDYLLNINREYLQHDYYTDIITFNYCENDIISGDLFISIDTVIDNAKTFDVSFESEFRRVVIHGILHLIGFDDKTDIDQEEMTKQENISLDIFN